MTESREDQIQWLSGALGGCGVSSLDVDRHAATLYDQGVRVIDTRTERVVKLEDGPTFVEVMATWEQKKAEARAATVTSDSSEVTVDVKPQVAGVGYMTAATKDRARRQDAFPGLCVTLMPTGRLTVPWRPMAYICGDPEQDLGRGACGNHLLRTP